MARGPLFIGTAGWSIPANAAARFPGAGSHLERYASVLPAVEINSSFYRPHRAATYERWAAATPAAFRFSLKIPKASTHGARLADPGLLLPFIKDSGLLGPKRGPLLAQLPPSLPFERSVADRFFGFLEDQAGGPLACEPRHASWFTAEAEELLIRRRVARVAADPVRAEGGNVPGGWPGFTYHRLHGSPHVYHSSYDAAMLAALARQTSQKVPAWIIFDNTARGAASDNALDLLNSLSCCG